ncbi:LytR C-terminal domain-containing protein [Candidatus Shapirobacteria bacterium]|nr:LytR C-terminal domain-containing protein [Candidatus Shapirobacteria bacterium]
MALFSKPRVVIWPKDNSVNIYLDRTENNIFSLDINLWKSCSESDLQALSTLFTEQGIDTATILIPDDVVFTKSFIYDSEITEIDKNEVIGLAKSFISFKISPEYINYDLVQSSGKTIIQARIFEKSKITALEDNLRSLNLKTFSFESVSQSIANIISQKYTDQYFLIFPLENSEYLLMLAAKDTIYLTSIIKGKELEIQKLINYSKLYFPNIITKIFVPTDLAADLIATTKLDKSPYSQSSFATEYKKTSNLPVPVLGVMVSKSFPPGIMNTSDTNSSQPKMENKKNILPFIAVFVVTAALASIIIWFVLNKNSENTPETPIVDTTPTVVQETPTEAPTPTIAPVSKTLKLQVLNATDINGQAAVLKEKLTKLGFTSIAVGNSKDKLTENKLQIKVSQASASAYFVQELAGFFDVVPTTDLPETSTYDAVFSIGIKLEVTGDTSIAPSLKTTVTPSATATKSASTATPTAKANPTVTSTE